MPDLRDRFRELGADVAGLSRPAPSEVRRAAELRRTAVRVATAACVTVAGVVAAVAVAVSQTRGGPAQTLQPAGNSPSASATSASASPAPPARAWLPAPWTVVSADSSTWSAGTRSAFRFCGSATTYHEPVAVTEQVLAHPSGQRAHLLRFETRTPSPYNLFKLTYANCLVPGRAESIGGPRNVWSYGAVAGAAEMVGPSLRLVEVTGSPAGPPATRDQATAALDAWTP